MLNIRRLSANATGFRKELDQLLAWETVSNDAVNDIVKEVVLAVKTKGDAALLEYTARFDRLQLKSGAELEIPTSELQAALERIPQDQREGLQISAERVRDYHKKQIQKKLLTYHLSGRFLENIYKRANLSMYNKNQYPTNY